MVIASVLSANCHPLLIEISSIEGYGIAYIGFGDVGCFKLIIKFGQVTKIITKLKLEQHFRPQVASKVDSLLDYCINKMEKMSTAK